MRTFKPVEVLRGTHDTLDLYNTLIVSLHLQNNPLSTQHASLLYSTYMTHAPSTQQPSLYTARLYHT